MVFSWAVNLILCAPAQQLPMMQPKTGERGAFSSFGPNHEVRSEIASGAIWLRLAHCLCADYAGAAKWGCRGRDGRQWTRSSSGGW